LSKIANYLSKVHGIHNPKTLIIHEKKTKIFFLDGKLHMCIILKNNNEVRTNAGQFLLFNDHNVGLKINKFIPHMIQKNLVAK
jgi:hypothetical protein